MTANRPMVALVTGASSGIGKAAALALAQAGFEVAGTSRRPPRDVTYDSITFLELDVTSDESVSSVVKQVVDRFGGIDVLVNNAGTGAAGAAEESSLAQDQALFDINVFGLIRMTKAVLPHMRARGSGRIINVSSIFGFIPQPFGASYVASKHAVEGYSESVDHEVRDHGIRVLLVEPAATRTGFEAAMNAPLPSMVLPAYAQQYGSVNAALAEAFEAGDDPATVARAILAAATDPKPKLRYAPHRARQIAMVRRVAPARLFDRQIRRFNKMTS